MKLTHLVSGSSNQPLTGLLSSASNLPQIDCELSKFANQELRIRLLESGQSIAIVQSFSSPVNSHIIETLLIADAARRMGTKNLVAVIPYFGYSKQDKVFLPGEPLSAKVISQVLQTSKITQLITVDLHNPSIAGYFDIPVTNLSADDIFVHKLKNNIQPNSIIVSPDAGSIKSAGRFSQKLGIEVAHINKSRDLETGEVTINSIDKPVKDMHTYIFDDMIATGSTLIKSSQFLKSQGASSVSVCATHHLFISGVQEKLDQAPIDKLIITDSIKMPSKLKSEIIETVSIAPLLSQALD